MNVADNSAGRNLNELWERRIGDAFEGAMVKMIFGAFVYKRARGDVPVREVRTGLAKKAPLGEPLTTPYGTFDKRRVYLKGCVPATELTSGVGVLFFDATSTDEGKPELTFEMGKAPERLGGYRIVTLQTIGNDLQRVADVTVPESGLPPELVIGNNLVPFHT